MPEEKKESFTFSDKIKSSKPAGSKSFAKSSSKIGRDGKPRQTLFERTRRDAPFFIAALVALLLLPFLYKYSGSGSESTLLTPGDGEAIFNPEQYGFDTVRLEDPDAQIAQLSGKSTFDLINWGKEAELEDEDMRTDMDIDAAADASASAGAEASGRYDATHSSRTDIDEEENITNIYKKRAKAGTRAAFKRTPIGNLKNASMKGGKGSPLKVKEWGGRMKDAANKVKDSGPRNAPKPVSLQPLRAGGPARSTFGQGGAAAARKGLDNMGKANAVEALRDSYVKPSETSTLGGISLAETGRSGGSGKLDHNINIGRGETPWWWDMMKTRMQKEWEARFNRKWDWIKWADKLLQNILGGLINCIITGNSDGDPDTFFGYGGGSGGKSSECCGMNEKKWNASHPGVAFTSDACKGWMTTQFGEKYKEKCPSGWVEGRSGDEDRLGPLGIRGKCLGLAFGAYTSGELGLNAASGMDCEDMPLHYSVIPSGQARKWNIYTYVVARNYFPESLAEEFPGLWIEDRNGKGDVRKNLLCASVDKKRGGTGLEHNVSRAGVGHVEEELQGAKLSIAKQIAKTNKVSSHQQKIRAEILEVDQESLSDACVILVAKGNAISYNQVKNQIIDNFMKLGKGVSEAEAIKAFNSLDLLFVSSVAMKDTIAWHSHDVNRLPMPYWEFENAYINHKGVSSGKNGYMYKVHDKKWRVEGTDMMKGPICFYDSIQAECAPKEKAALHVKFNRNYQGGKGGQPGFNVAEAAKDIKVSFKYEIKGNSMFTTPGFEQPSGDVVPPTVLADNTLEYRAEHRIVSYDGGKIEEKDPVKREEQIAKLMANNDFGYIEWTVKRGDQSISTVKCPFGMSGDGAPPQDNIDPDRQGDCDKGQRRERRGIYQEFPDCPYYQICQDDGTWPTKWEPVDLNLPECQPQGGNPNPPPPQEIVVDFYREYQDFPCDDKIYNGPRRQQSESNTEDEITDPCPDWQGCKLTTWDAVLIAPDNITIGYVQQSIDEFNKRNAGNKVKFKSYTDAELKDPETGLTAAKLVDAIRMNPSPEVPANVVCVLGKTIGGAANDPQNGNFDNVFGAFLAFMGLDASSFPGKWTYDCGDGQSVIENKRFPCGSGYWWGGYVDSNQQGLKGYGKRATSFNDKQFGDVWKGFPLSGLLRGEFPVHGGDKGLLEKPDNMDSDLVNMEEYYRDQFSQTYWDLLHNEECKYPANVTLSKADVLDYVERLCKYDDEVKPMAWLECNSSNKNKQVRKPQGRKRGVRGQSRKKSVNRKKTKQQRQQRVKKKMKARNKKCVGC